jgi:hypothetical protein
MGQTATNLGTAGSVLDAQYGSTTGADTNDPLLLEHDGTNYLYLPGSSGNYASLPDANFMPVADWECIVGMAPGSDWATTSFGAFCGNTNQTSTGFRFSTGNGVPRLALSWWDTGTASFRTVGANADSAAGTDLRYVRVTLDVDNGAAGCDTAFYTGSTVSGPWTQIGTTVTTATVANPGYSAAAGQGFGIGSQKGDQFQNGLLGSYHRVVIRSAGATIADINFTTGITSGGQTTFTESSSNAATVTINRSTSGRKSVAVVRDVWLFGTDDYMQVADNDLLDFGASDSFTVVAVTRSWATGGGGQTVIAKQNLPGGTNAGYSLYRLTGGIVATVADGSVAPFTQTADVALGSLAVSSFVRDVAADLIRPYMGTTALATATDTTTGSLANAQPLQVGRGGVGIYADMELLGVAVFRRALSADELTSIANYYGAS